VVAAAVTKEDCICACSFDSLLVVVSVSDLAGMISVVEK